MGRPKKKDQIDKDYILAKIEKTMAKAHWHELSIAGIAKKVGVKSPSIYHYFSGLEGLRNELSMKATIEFAEVLAESLVSVPQEQKVRVFFETYRAFSKENPFKFECVQFGIASQNKELLQKAYKIVQLATEASDLKTPDRSLEEIIHKVRIIRCLLNGFIDLESNGGFQLEQSSDETFEYLIRSAKAILELKY